MPMSAVDRVEIALDSGDTVSGELIAWSKQVYEVNTGERVIGIEDGKVISDISIEAVSEKSEVVSQKNEAVSKQNAEQGFGGPRIPLDDPPDDLEEAAQDQRRETAALANAAPLLVGYSAPTDEGAEEAIFELRLSRAASMPIAILYSAVERGAKSGADYRESAGVVTIKIGETSATVSVPIIDDDHAEPDESFELFLTIAPGVAEIRERYIAAVILDND